MKLELGNIKVEGEQDVIHLRNKIVSIFDILFDDNIFAIKASSLLSTVVKRIRAVNATLELDSFIRLGRGTDAIFYIRISSTESISIPHLLKNYHSAIHLKEENGSFQIAIHGKMKSENFEQAREIYSKPSLDDLIHEMKVKNIHLEESFENLKKAKDLNLRMESELEVGKNIQMSMLPGDFPANNYIELYASLKPAREVGGDFYDFYFIDENHFCFVVGDVSGKGVPAALMMAVTKTLLKSRASSDMSTASILTHVNNEIAADNDANMFITIFMAILDTVSGELVYSNGGHNPSFLLSTENNSMTKLTELHGPVVGALPELTYKEAKLQLSKNDCIFAYTDGVTEAMNSDNELFSDPRLEAFLSQRINEKPDRLVSGIIEEVVLFEKGKEQADDITVLAIRYKEDPQAVSVRQTSITITNKLEEIARLQNAFGAFANESSIPIETVRRFNIIFDELLNNIISYAFTDDESHEILIDIKLQHEKLIVTIKDDGIPFNPFAMETPDTNLSIEERNIGGLGIHLVKNLIDNFVYKRDVHNNIITLIKEKIIT